MTALTTQAPPTTSASTRSRRSPAARLLLASIRFYQAAVSPALAPACRYSPSCSAYAVEAVEVHGAGRGSWLALRRLLRCHPFHAGGHDPVPPPVERSDRSPDSSTNSSTDDLSPTRADTASPQALGAPQ